MEVYQISGSDVVPSGSVNFSSPPAPVEEVRKVEPEPAKVESGTIGLNFDSYA